MHSRGVHQDDAVWEGPRIVDARRDQRRGGRLRLQGCVAKPAIAISFDEPLHRGITKVADAVEENEWWLGLADLVGTQPPGYSRRISPTSLFGSAPSIGSNFCTRPMKQSARNRFPSWSVVIPWEQAIRPAGVPGAPQLYR